MFSLLGFEQAVQLGGEARNPAKDLPRAVILSILIGGAVYILLQVAFIGALNPKLLTHGAHLDGPRPARQASAALKALDAAPFYQVAKVAGLAWLALVLRLDAFVSPSGTGLIYLTSASRISFGLSKNGYIPSRVRAQLRPGQGAGVRHHRLRASSGCCSCCRSRAGQARRRGDQRLGADVRRGAAGARRAAPSRSPT